MNAPNKQRDYVTRNRQQLTANERTLQRLEQFHCFNALDNIRQGLPLTWKERKALERKIAFDRKYKRLLWVACMMIALLVAWFIVPGLIDATL